MLIRIHQVVEVPIEMGSAGIISADKMGSAGIISAGISGKSMEKKLLVSGRMYRDCRLSLRSEILPTKLTKLVIFSEFN